MAITHEYANVNDVTLHYARAGKGKKLIIFLHGFPEFWYAYKKQLDEFSNSEEYTVIAPDMRGYNLSSKPPTVAEYQLKFLVEDLRQLAGHLGYAKCTLVAHDWGGVVTWWFSIVHPGYLDKLIIINAPHPAIFLRELTDNPEQQKASLYMQFFCDPGAEQMLSVDNFAPFFATVFGGLEKDLFSEQDKQAYLKAWSQPGALTGSLNYYRAATNLGPGLHSSSYQVNIPTLVIWGEKDKYLMTSNLTGLEEYVPELTVKRIPGASHWVIHEEPALVNRYIREFIS